MIYVNIELYSRWNIDIFLSNLEIDVVLPFPPGVHLNPRLNPRISISQLLSDFFGKHFFGKSLQRVWGIATKRIQVNKLLEPIDEIDKGLFRSSNPRLPNTS